MSAFNLSEIASWERFYRANFINSLSGFKSLSLIGTMNKQGQTNLAVFSNIVHLGADPPLIGFINRPLAAAPHTIANIEATGVYTMNQVLPSFVDKAHQTSAKYEAGQSEFDEVGLTPEFVAGIEAPFVKESVIKYALRLQEIIPIKISDTFLVIGKITQVFVDENLISDDGFIALEKANTVCSNSIDSYYSTNLLGRYQYAKPNFPSTSINGNSKKQ
jgi:flavin reductase (DIM6/NTAB) family NADH-FMN oxidoreductase RutF